MTRVSYFTAHLHGLLMIYSLQVSCDFHRKQIHCVWMQWVNTMMLYQTQLWVEMEWRQSKKNAVLSHLFSSPSVC